MAADNPIDPIHQFEISKIADIQLGGIDISFTNSLYLWYSTRCNNGAICYWSF